MADEGGEKTEDATPRKREQAREKGNVPLSKDMNVAAAMACVAAILWLAGPYIAEQLAVSVRTPFDQVQLVLTRDDAIMRLLVAGRLLGMVVAVPMLIMFVGALFANLLQVGFLWSTDALTPNIGRMNPIKNIQQILSSRALMKLAVSLGKLVLLGALSGWAIWSTTSQFGSLIDAAPGEVASAVGHSSALLASQLAAALIVLGMADLAFQRWKHAQDLKMSKQEIRDEMKEMEGDPFIRQRRKEAHRKLAQAKEMAAVPDADGVITNPTHYSIAFKYDADSMAAPVVVAKGVDERALRIREVARQHGVPIIERPALARRLWAEVKTGQMIPPDLYQVFVELLAYIYRLKRRAS